MLLAKRGKRTAAAPSLPARAYTTWKRLPPRSGRSPAGGSGRFRTRARPGQVAFLRRLSFQSSRRTSPEVILPKHASHRRRSHRFRWRGSAPIGAAADGARFRDSIGDPRPARSAGKEPRAAAPPKPSSHLRSTNEWGDGGAFIDCSRLFLHRTRGFCAREARESAGSAPRRLRPAKPDAEVSFPGCVGRDKKGVRV